MLKSIKTFIIVLGVFLTIAYVCDTIFRKFFVVNYNSPSESNQSIIKDNKSRFIIFEINNILKNDFSVVFAKYFQDKDPANILKTKYAENHLDALRHVYMSARLASIYPENFVRLLGEINELRYGAANDRADLNMDLWNNEVGIQIGLKNKGASKDKIINEVFNCLKEIGKENPPLCITDKNRPNNHVAEKSVFFSYVFEEVFKRYNIVFEI